MPEPRPGEDLLARAADRAAARSFFLAATLRAYAEAEGIDDRALAARLGCPPTALPALRLCRRPELGPSFRAGVQRIAERFRLDPAALADVIRLADAIVALGDDAPRQTSAGGLLAAARDRDHEGALERGEDQ